MPSPATPIPATAPAASAAPSRAPAPEAAGGAFAVLVGEATKANAVKAQGDAQTPTEPTTPPSADAGIFVAGTDQGDARPADAPVVAENTAKETGDSDEDRAALIDAFKAADTARDTLALRNAFANGAPVEETAAPKPATSPEAEDEAVSLDADAVSAAAAASASSLSPSNAPNDAPVTADATAPPAASAQPQQEAVAPASRMPGEPSMSSKASSAEMPAAAEDIQAASLSKSQTAPAEIEPSDARRLAELAANAPAALKETRPASERAPGEMLRAGIRGAASAEPASASVSDAKPTTTTTETSAAPRSAPPSPVATPPNAAPSPQIPTPATAAPAFDVLLGQMAGEMAAEPAVLDGDVDLSLSKSSAVTDGGAMRLDARAEIRTASTLQFAQGPRLTPQSAQSMAAQIAQRFNDGGRVFDIRLDPPELGRVEVRLELGSDNTVRALLAAERTETLAELQRSARDLERALAEAGLDVGEDALSFSLTGDDAASGEEMSDEQSDALPILANGDDLLDLPGAPLAPISTYGFLLARAEGLDVSV